MITHELKTHPAPFQAVLDDKKRFEYRKNDRNFQVGDSLRLREWAPDSPAATTGNYTGREIHARVTYMLAKGYGLPDGFVILSIERSWS